MSIITDLLNLFGNHQFRERKENFELYTSDAQLEFHDSLSDNAEKISALIEALEQSDVDLSLSFNLHSGQPINLSTSELKVIESALEQIDDLKEHLTEDEVPTVSIRIPKESRSVLHLFDSSEFYNHLKSLTLSSALDEWQRYDLSRPVKILIWEESENYSTNIFKASSIYPNPKPSELQGSTQFSDRKGIIEKRDKCAHFANASSFQFIPSDFIVNDGTAPKPIEDHFNGILNTLLIIFIADFSAIEDGFLKCRLKGYKLVSDSLSLQDLCAFNSKELESIFSWAYSEGNYTDKIGLSRNIISIHLENDSLLSIEEGTADSVRSGYDLYLKENVKQYIEIKNKISEFIQSQSDKALEITKSMFSMFKTGLWTFTTFFITVFLLRALNKGSLEGAFTFEIFSISLLLIFISFLYLSISILELNSDRNRLLEKYSDIRKRYQDLLDQKDLDKILNENDIKETEKKYINEKRNKYAAFWIATNFALLITVFALYYSNNEIERPEPPSPAQHSETSSKEKVTPEPTSSSAKTNAVSSTQGQPPPSATNIKK